MKKYIKYAGIVIILILTVFMALFYRVRHSEFYKMEGLKFSPYISENSIVKQSFTPNYSDLDKVGILIWFDNEKVDDGIVKFEILDNNNKVVYFGQTTIAAQNIGAYYYFNTGLKVDTNKVYTIEISAENCTTSNPKIGLIANGDIAHQYVYLSYPPYYMYVTYVAIALLMIFVYLWLVKNISLIYRNLLNGTILKTIFSKKMFLLLFSVGCVAGCLFYNNSLDNTGHLIGLYMLELSLGLITLGCMKKQDWSLPWFLGGVASISIIIGIFLYKNYEVVLASKLLFGLKSGSFLIWGFLFVILIHKFVRKQIKLEQFRKIPLILWILFITAMLVFGINVEWRVFVTICFSIFYLMPIEKTTKNLIQNAMYNAMLVMLLGIVAFSMAFRPIDYIRYPSVFHTTNWGSEFFLAAIVILTCKLYTQVRNKDRIRSMSLNLFLWGVAWSYLLYTSSRGSLIAAAACSIIAVIVLLINRNDKKTGYIFQCAGIFILVILISYPIIYCMQRSIPYIVNKPFHYEFELKSHGIIADQDIDAADYFDLSENIESLYARVVPSQIQVLFSKTSKNADAVEATVEESTITNSQMESIYGEGGRRDIITAHLKNLGIWGKSEGVLVGTEVISNAHNTFVQMAYAFGIITGILFILFIACQFIYMSIRLFKKTERGLNQETSTLFNVLAVLGFVCFGLLECGIWPMHILTFYMYFSTRNFLRKEIQED